MALYISWACVATQGFKVFPAFPGVPDTRPDTMSRNLQQATTAISFKQGFPKSNHQQRMNNTVQLSSIFGCLELEILKQLLIVIVNPALGGCEDLQTALQ